VPRRILAREGGAPCETDDGMGLALSSLGQIPSVEKSMWRLLKEFLLFARQEKKWWLIPLVVLLLVLGAILIFASSSGIAWALYPLF